MCQTNIKVVARKQNETKQKNNNEMKDNEMLHGAETCGVMRFQREHECSRCTADPLLM